MERMNFEDYYDLADFMYDVAAVEKSTVCAVLNYKQTIELLRSLLVFDDVEVITIDASHSVIKNYDREYYVTLSRDLKLFVEPVFSNGEISENYSDVFLFDGDASSRIAIKNKGIQFEISVGEETENCDFEDCKRELVNDALKAALDVLEYIFCDYK